MEAKRTYRCLKRLISILVCFSMICGLIPLSSLPKAVAATDTVDKPAVSTPQELTQYRTENSKRFLNPDGTLTEKIYIDPIHYKDTSGKWQDIDSNLVLASNGNYRNKANRFNVELAPTAHAGYFKYTQDGATLSFKPSFAGAANGGVKGHKMGYKDVTTDIDINYEVKPNGLKETIVLKSAKVPTTFSFKLKMESLTYQSQQDGSVAFYKPGVKKPIFYMAKPFLVDADLNSTSATYQFRQDKDGETVLDLLVDPEWLNDPNRAYPVLLDPTVQDSPDVSDTFISDTNPNTNYGNWSHIYVGKGTSLGTTRSLFWFQLPSLPSSAFISSSTLTVTNTSIYVTGSPVVEAHRITEDWDANTVTYNNKPSIGSSEPPYTVINTTTPSNWDIDVSSLVRDWYTGNVANRGVELKYADENLTMRELAATDDATQSYHPCLNINYEINPMGYEDFWTYAGDVNIANGNLVLSDSDLNVPGRGIPTTVTRTYNSRSSNSTGNFGYGWNSELDVKILPVDKGPIAYFDADRSVHYFKQLADESYVSPPGLYLTLKKNVDGTYTITEKSGITYNFLSTGGIASIADAQENTLTYEYEPTKTRITGITDSSGRTTSIHYGTDNRVDTVTDYAGRQSTYGYSPAGDLIRVTNAAGTADEITTYYEYDTNHNLISVTNPRGYKTYYHYSAEDRVQSISSINKALNANFEVDSDANNIPDLWSLYAGQSGTSSLEAASDVPFGFKSFKVTAANTNTYGYSVYQTEPIPVDRTKAYTLSANIKASQSSGSQATILSLMAYNSSNQYLGEFGRQDNAGAFGWKSINSSLTENTLPLDTAYVKIKVGVSNGTGSGTSWFDGVQLEEGSTQSDFVGTMTYTFYPPGLSSAFYDANGKKTLYTYNENANATSVSIDPAGLNYTSSYTWGYKDRTEKYDNELTAMKDANANAVGGVNSVSNEYDPSGNGNLNSVQVVDDTSDSIINSFTYDPDNNDLLTIKDGNANASKTNNSMSLNYDNQRNPINLFDSYSTYTNNIFDYSGNGNGNLIKQTAPIGLGDSLLINSSLERDSNSDNWPDNWSLPVIGGSGTANWGTTPYSGQKGLTISNVSGFVTVGNSDYFVVGENDYFTLTGYVKATTADAAKAAYIKLDAYNANNEPIGQVASNRIGEADKWNRLMLTVTKESLPQNTAKVQAVAVVNTTSGTVYFDNFQLEKTSFASTYNFLENASFELGASLPYSWCNTTPIEYQWDGAEKFSGSKSIKISNPSNWAGYAPNYVIPYESNKSYTLSGVAKAVNLSNLSGAYIKFNFYDSNLDPITTGSCASNTLPNSNADWTRLDAVLNTKAENAAPPDTAYIKPVVTANNFTGTVYFDDIRLNEGQAPITSYEYNAADGNGKGAQNYVTKITDPQNNSVNYTYDAVGNIKTVTDALNHTTSFDYDKLDRLKSVSLPDGENLDLKTKYNYDANGNRTQVINKNKSEIQPVTYNTTSYSYNNLDLITSITDPLNKVTTFRYDDGGNLTTIEYPNNKKLGYTYNQANRLDKVSFDGTTKYTFGYDPNGNRTSVQDNSTNKTWSYIFDKVDRLIKVIAPDNSTQENTYDKNSNRLSQKITVGAETKNISYVYNSTDSLVQVSDPSGKQNVFGYDERNNLARLKSGNDILSSREYNLSNWLSKVVNAKANGEILSSYDYTFNNNGNRETVTDQTGKTITYEYDSNNRLLSETDPLSDNTFNYVYDSLGNRTKKTVKDSGGNVLSTIEYEYNAANQLTKVGGQSYTYDEVGDYDLADDGTKKYFWDVDGRLTEVRKKSDNSLIAQYEYDADGRRVKSTVGGVVTNYHYDGNSINVLYETDGSGNLTNLYTYSSNGLLLSLTKSGQTYYYHYNGHGDVTQLTDFSGNVVASYTYDAWGNILQSSGTMAASNPYRYAGYRYDSETGMYYLMARYYTPNLGRFISRDAIDTNNLYAYCGNNPVNMIDPTGYASLWDDFKKIPHTVSSSVMTTVHDPVFVPALKQTGAAVGLAAVNVATAAYGDVAIAAVAGRITKARPALQVTEGTVKTGYRIDLQLFAKKKDIKQIESVAKEFKMTPAQRREFGDYVESLKDIVRNDRNFSYSELKQIAKEFLRGY